GLVAELPIQPRRGKSPVSKRREGRDLQHFRCFFNGQAAEETKLHNAALARIQFRQARESLIERNKVGAFFRRKDGRLIKLDGTDTGATLLVSARPGVVDENAAHHLGGDGEEVRAILPSHILPV